MKLLVVEEYQSDIVVSEEKGLSCFALKINIWATCMSLNYATIFHTCLFLPREAMAICRKLQVSLQLHIFQLFLNS